MNEATKSKGLNWRGLTTMILSLFFLILAVSGVILYASPQGRVANWTGWTIWGLTKHEWAALHITTAAAILIVSGLHLFFNWRVFVYYFKSRRAKGLHLKKEMALATTITVLYVVGTVTNAPPLAHILRGNDWFKVYWERSSASGPVAHAEELTLEGIGERVNFSAEEVLTQIIAAGYEVPDPSATFGEIAEANGTSPDALYQTLFPSKGRGRQGRGFGGRGGCTEDLAEDTKETCEIAGDSHTQEAPHSQSLQRGSGGGGGRGLGQMTLAQLCQEESVDMETALARLREQNIEASGDHPIREIANQLGMHPRDILGFITQTNTADHPK